MKAFSQAINAYAKSFCPPGALKPLWPALRSRPFDAYAPGTLGASQNPLRMILPVMLIVASGLCKAWSHRRSLRNEWKWLAGVGLFTLFAIPMGMELLEFLSMQAAVERLTSTNWACQG